MVSLLLCCNAADESSCSMFMMASTRCSGKVLQALSESGSGQASWSLSAALFATGNLRDLAAAARSWDPCWVNGLTVFCGRKKPNSPERLRPSSADCFACVVRISSDVLSGDCMLLDQRLRSKLTELLQAHEGLREDQGLGVNVSLLCVSSTTCQVSNFRHVPTRTTMLCLPIAPSRVTVH